MKNILFIIFMLSGILFAQEQDSSLYVTTIRHTTDYFILNSYLYGDIPLKDHIMDVKGEFEYNDKLKQMFIDEYNLGRDNPKIQDKITWVAIGATIGITAMLIARSQR